MKHAVALIPLLVLCGVHAGQPLLKVLQLRSIEVQRCDIVTPNNVGQVSRFVRASNRTDSGVRPNPAQVADSVPGVLVTGLVLQQRDVSFSNMGSNELVSDSHWIEARPATPATFFAPGTPTSSACDAVVPGGRVNVVLSQQAECDTFPPEGICAFDHPIRLVDSATWAKYGQ